MKYGPRLSSASLTQAWVPPRTSHRLLWRKVAPWVGEGRNERAAISEIVIQYALDQQMEKDAKKPSDVKSKLSEWRSIAERITSLTDGARDEARHRTDELLAKGGVSIATLSELAGRILFLTRDEQMEEEINSLSDDGHFKPGAAWNRFVASLAELYETKTGMAATVNKSDRDGYSPTSFVKFVHAVQSFLPWWYWDHPLRKVEPQANDGPGTELNRAVDKVLKTHRAAGLKGPTIAVQ